MWKSTKVCTALLFMGHIFWKENTEDRVKINIIIGIKCVTLLS